MIATMIDLFPGPEIVATRTHYAYEVTAADGRLLASTRERTSGPGQSGSLVRRLLHSSRSNPAIEIDVRDASEVPRWEIALEPGDVTTFGASVSLADGTPVGRVGAEGGLLRPFPTIELTDAAGTRVGHATSKGAPQVFDAADRLVAELTWIGSRRPFDKPRWSLTFHDPDLSPVMRALAFAAIVAWDQRT